MKKLTLATAALAAATIGTTAASAQTMPMGAEIYNQNVQVRFADGTVNTVYFEEDGDAVIRAPGADPVNAEWRVVGDDLCLYASGDSECWSYANRFVAGQPMTLVSTCDAASTWTAAAVNPLAAPVVPAAPVVTPPRAPVVQPTVRSGERG